MKRVMSILLIGLLSACETQPTQPTAVPPTLSKMHFSADELFDFDKAILKHGSRSRDQLDELAIRLKTLTFDTVMSSVTQIALVPKHTTIDFPCSVLKRSRAIW